MHPQPMHMTVCIMAKRALTPGRVSAHSRPPTWHPVHHSMVLRRALGRLTCHPAQHGNHGAAKPSKFARLAPRRRIGAKQHQEGGGERGHDESEEQDEPLELWGRREEGGGRRVTVALCKQEATG